MKRIDDNSTSIIKDSNGSEHSNDSQKNYKSSNINQNGAFYNTKPFEGIWSHSSIIAGKERTHILHLYKDDKGQFKAMFLKQSYSYKPVFTGYAMDDDQMTINFKLIAYDTGHDSKYTIIYILKAEGESLIGLLDESWRPVVDVILAMSPNQVNATNVEMSQ